MLQGLVLLLLITATALLLHTALSDHEDPGLHVVEADDGGSGSGTDTGGQQQDVKGAQQGGGGKGTGDDAALFASTDGRKAGAVEEQQQEGLDEGEQAGQQAQQAQQAQQQAQAQQQQQQAQAQAQQQQQPQQGGAGSPSKFAQALQRQREEAAANRKQVRQPVPTSFPAQPEPEVVELSPEEVASRREAVKQAMVHAWGGYEKYAWGYDELCPLSQKGKNDFGGLGATIIDSLDTLHMMGLHEEYDRAAEWVRTQMPVDSNFDASVFETIIRVVGGLLSAHDLTGDPAMLKRAQEVADRLLPAYNTPTGIPLNILNLKTLSAKNPTWNQKASTLAEFGTHQLEFWRLSQRTGNATYAQLAEGTIRHLNKLAPNQGLMPLFISPRTGNFTARRVSLGALGDSYYEYLLKMWIIQGKSDDMYRAMWEQAMDEMIDKLVLVSKDNLTYIAEFERYGLKHKYDHLVCFVPGMLALGAHSGAVTGAKADRYIALAGELTHTCWQMYHRMPSGLSPEYVTFAAGGMRAGASYNLLRPEALEAMWYMWRLTHDWRYRTWGWEVFQAFERHCKAEAGYAGLKDVRLAQPIQDDTMQSFFLAETLKYLWLLFSDDATFNMDEWVLNTEAHPLRVSQPPQGQQAAPDAAAAEAARKKWWWPPGPGQAGLATGEAGAQAAVQQQRRRAVE